MDTDELSTEAYNLILIAARFDDSLKALMGASCSKYSNEEEYLEGLLELYEEIDEDPEDYFEEWGMPEVDNIKDYKMKLEELRKETKRVIKMEKADKHFEEC